MKRIVSFVALALVALAACSNSTPTANTGSQSPSTTASGDASAAFLEQFKNGFSSQKFRITYSIDANGQAQDVTIAQDPPKHSYKFGETLVIDDGTNTIICSAPQQPCTKSASSAAGLGLASAFLAPLTALRDSVASVSNLPGFASKGSKTIAGRSASCASWSYGPGSVDVCVDDATGILLSWAGTSTAGGATQTISWSATDFGTPSSADFTPTGTVQG